MVPGRVSWLLGWLVVLPRGPGLEGLGSFRISVCPVGAPLGPAAARGDPVGARAAEVKVLLDPAVSACKYHLQVVAADLIEVWGGIWGDMWGPVRQQQGADSRASWFQPGHGAKEGICSFWDTWARSWDAVG